jgi:hypothetical protein
MLFHHFTVHNAESGLFMDFYKAVDMTGNKIYCCLAVIPMQAAYENNRTVFQAVYATLHSEMFCM